MVCRCRRCSARAVYVYVSEKNPSWQGGKGRLTLIIARRDHGPPALPKYSFPMPVQGRDVTRTKTRPIFFIFCSPRLLAWPLSRFYESS
jgi:hypothetical protein